MKFYNKQLKITFIEAIMIPVLVTGIAFAGTIVIAGLGITTHFLFA